MTAPSSVPWPPTRDRPGPGPFVGRWQDLPAFPRRWLSVTVAVSATLLALVGALFAWALVRGNLGLATVLAPALLLSSLPMVLVLWGRGAYEHHRRHMAFVERTGWAFVVADPSLTTRWSGPPFVRHRDEQATYVMSGTFRGRRATSFTYSYAVDDTRSSCHVVALELSGPVPTVTFTPETRRDRVLGVLGAGDVDVASEAFNRSWRVGTNDARSAHALLSPRVVQRLVAPDAVGQSWRTEGATALWWAPGRADPDVVLARLLVLSDLADVIPAFLHQPPGYADVRPTPARREDTDPWTSS